MENIFIQRIIPYNTSTHMRHEQISKSNKLITTTKGIFNCGMLGLYGNSILGKTDTFNVIIRKLTCIVL